MKTGMSDLRMPAVAGTFYPAAPAQLRSMIGKFLQLAGSPATPHPTPKAMIVPHAGYLYSGPIAASGFQWLTSGARFERVVLLGPSHYASFYGLALPRAKAFATPLGHVRVDERAPAELAGLEQVRVFDQAHQPEHCLEVELPFLQCCLPQARIVPLLVGEAADEEVAEVMDRLWGQSETLFVVSSDLSHFLEYQAARELDGKTAACVEDLQARGIGRDQACGSTAIRGLLTVAQRRGLSALTVDLRNSGDTAGPRDRVVGYGAFALFDH